MVAKSGWEVFTTAIAIARDGGTHNMIELMQTRAELYDTIKLHDYEALDRSALVRESPF